MLDKVFVVMGCLENDNSYDDFLCSVHQTIEGANREVAALMENPRKITSAYYYIDTFLLED